MARLQVVGIDLGSLVTGHKCAVPLWTEAYAEPAALVTA